MEELGPVGSSSQEQMMTLIIRTVSSIPMRWIYDFIAVLLAEGAFAADHWKLLIMSAVSTGSRKIIYGILQQMFTA
jgi:hypothetical protein